MATSAAKLCDGYRTGIFQLDADGLRLVAHHGPIPALGSVGQGRLPLLRGLPPARAVLDREIIHVTDLQAETADYPQGSDFARQLGFRAALAVPLMRAGEAIGVITIRRTEAVAFTARQIELLKTFADQAVIAIENARLFEAEQVRTRELGESLEQQTATSQVLGIISSARGELEPVFQAVLANAVRFCAAKFGTLWLAEGDDYFRSAAIYDLPPALAEARRREPVVRFAPETGLGRVIATRQVVHVDDMSLDPAYLAGNPRAVLLAEQGRARTVVFVPMLKQDEVIGALTIYRQEIRPFTHKQIELVRSFASQAVIAIENVRLLEAEQAGKRELQESLEYQTATGEVLNVIRRSPTNAQPVFDAIVESAARLCDAAMSVVWLYDGARLHYAASHNFTPEVLERIRATYPKRPDRSIAAGRAILDRSVSHIPDMLADSAYAHELAMAGNWRASAAVPMLRDGEPVGAISIGKAEAAPFTPRQIQLLCTFADQAVIAIENARLFEEVQSRTRELQESLEYQTATSDVLAVISKSPDSVHPVFEAIITMAERLCGADFGFVYRLHDDNRYHLVAAPRASKAYRNYRSSHPVVPGDESIMGRALRERAAIHVADVKNDRQQVEIEAHRLGNIRSALAVPLMNAGRAIGVMGVVRSTPNPFSQRQVELVETFADQAVIAIENARLFEEVQSRTRELQESLEYQTATSDVLQVISSSPGHLQPIYETMLAKALRHCDAKFGGLFRYEGGAFRGVAGIGVPEGLLIGIDEGANSLAANSDLKSLVASRQTMHSADLRQNASYLAGDPFIVGAVERGGARAALLVPLVKDDDLIGALAVYRREARSFSDKQVQLVQTFADQAVIAIENTRLFEEVQVRTRELAKTVEDLEIASQHKSQFVANMSHELRTPLAAILGYAELMEEGFYDPLGQKSLDALARIRSNGKHLLGLINTVLDIAKIESGQFTLNMTEYDIQSIVETVRS
ncbi:MAG: GAF domain-containing protein, partial [Hyphomicrobiaceae bacterium]